MILGMSLSTFTLVHVIISIVGIVTGLVVLHGMFASDTLPGSTAAFLVTTILTSVTGYFFPFTKILPSHIVGAISLVVLAIALVALYGFHLARSWRWIYVTTALFALYLNCFVLVAQAFLKVAFLKTLAPTQSDPPFIIAQVAVMAAFILLGIKALGSFHREADQAALRPV